MTVHYAASYTDRVGTEVTSIANDGTALSMVVRGVEFAGPDFDGLEPVAGTDHDRLASFTLQGGTLCSCVIEADIPIPVATPAGTEEGVLTARLELGNPAPNGGLDREHLTLELRFAGRAYKSGGRSGWFEDEMLDVQGQLPHGTYLRACITCAFSDYSPAGHGLFGGLACFRDNKAEYLAVRSKTDLFRVWGTMTGFVQETYLCPDFERRRPGTGYRG
jgi:Family of unknown function (DUF6304)